MAAESYPLPKPAKTIGVPYKGTHARAFNVAGGSNNWESENAVDLATPKGTPVYAVAAGTIGSQIGAQGGGRFAGLRVHLVTQGNEYYYAHLSKLVVKAGQTVKDGQLLGYSGVANGVSHLHFAAKSGDPRQIFSQGNPTHTQAPTDNTMPSTGEGAANTASGITAPYDVIPPSSPLNNSIAPDVSMPGSQSYVPYTHQQSNDLWQQVANNGLVSQDTQLMVSNAALASGQLGGANAGG